MTIEGTLDEFRLPDILQMVGQQGKTGILTVQGESTIVAVSFLSGRVVAADSLEETVEERLGEVLVRERLLTRQEFAQVVERQRQGQGRLIDLLVEGGHLERHQVLESLRLQTTELLGRLLAWRSGEFKFYANDEVAYEEGFRPVAVDDLLLSLLPPEEAPEGALPSEESGEAEEVEVAGDPTGAAALAVAGGGEAMAPVVPLPVTRWDDDLADTAAPVFVPPDEAARPVRRTASAADPLLWLPTVFAALLAVALLAALAADPATFLLPLPWQGSERAAYQSVQRQAAYQSVDGAAKTFFLIEGRFPESLERLVELSLLDAEDLADPSGAPLRLTAREDSYELRPLASGGGDELAAVEAISGNFLLDPDYLTATHTDAVAPLVLLD